MQAWRGALLALTLALGLAGVAQADDGVSEVRFKLPNRAAVDTLNHMGADLAENVTPGADGSVYVEAVVTPSRRRSTRRWAISPSRRWPTSRPGGRSPTRPTPLDAAQADAFANLKAGKTVANARSKSLARRRRHGQRRPRRLLRELRRPLHLDRGAHERRRRHRQRRLHRPGADRRLARRHGRHDGHRRRCRRSSTTASTCTTATCSASAPSATAARCPPACASRAPTAASTRSPSRRWTGTHGSDLAGRLHAGLQHATTSIRRRPTRRSARWPREFPNIAHESRPAEQDATATSASRRRSSARRRRTTRTSTSQSSAGTGPTAGPTSRQGRRADVARCTARTAATDESITIAEPGRRGAASR